MQHQPVGARGERGGAIPARFLETPAGAPFIVHLAEGVDRDARLELDRLDAIGCLASHTVLVHGLAIDGDGWNRLTTRGSGVVWCPASNHFLFGDAGRTPIWSEPGRSAASNVALATDSRLTGSRDLLDELRIAHASSSIEPADLLRMVTSTPARLLRLPHAGRLAVGAPADLCIVPARADAAAASLLAASRRDVELVVVGGRPAIGAPSMAPVFSARRVTTRDFSVDGAGKIADAALVRRISRCSIDEPGVVAG
jgi:cytosine/adenosine deaminase-related metal-dependent hydrolase